MITLHRIRDSKPLYVNTQKYHRQVTTLRTYRTEQLRREAAQREITTAPNQ